MRTRTLTLGLLAVMLVWIPSTAQQSVNLPGLDARVRANYGKLPLTFEANQGQMDPQVRFVSRGPGYTAFLTGDGMVLSLRAQQVVANRGANVVPASPAKYTTLQFRLLGAARNPAVVGEVPQPGRVNYFIGNNPAKWQRNVPTYAQVRYKNVYPGIDLLYHGNRRQLEYDFAVAPGADPGRIQFEISGANRIHIDTGGALVLATANGEIHFQTPIVYQESNGQRVAVNGGYVVNDPTHVSFRVARYDPNKPLVIDPVLLYSTYLGGSGNDQPGGIAVDAAGNVYVAGSTDSTDFPLTTLGALPAGNIHVFVAKLDAAGSNLIYADYLGGDGEDYGYAVALDAANNVYVAGSTASSDFPMVNPYMGTFPGSFNAFLTKISPDGSSLSYSTYFGGNGADLPSSVAVDAAGEMIIAGYTSSTNLPVANAYQSTVSPNQGGNYGNYGFLTKFSTDGSSLVFSTYLAGDSNMPLNCGGSPCWPQPASSIAGMVLDAAGNAYVTGTTNTYNFPVTSGAYITTNSAPPYSSVGFVSKFSGSGSLQYSTYFYEASGLLTNTTAIAVDSSGSAYVTGIAFSDGTFPVTSTSICDPAVYLAGCGYAFVTKFDAAGATLLYSTFLGPNNNASPWAIVLDGQNDAYVLSSTGSGAFSMVNGIENYSNGTDALLVEIDAAASSQLFATYLGGSVDDQPAPAGMVLDASGNLYIAGMTDSSDFPVTQSAFQNVLGGNNDAFILKIGPASAPGVSLSPASLQYASQAIGSSSPPQNVLLRNMGSSPLSIFSITPAADFAETDNCGSSVSSAGTCTLSVTFTPIGPGSRSGTISIQDDAAGAPHVISLSGSAVGPFVVLTPASLSFSNVPVGTSTAAQTVTLANTGNVALSISSIQVAGDYAETDNCPASVSAGSNCVINVTFTPTASGSRAGTVTISDSAAGSPQIVGLSGTGYVPAPVVGLTPASLSFSSVLVGTSSTAQAVTLANTGNAALSVSSIQVAGDYTQSNNCPASVSAGSSCVINVTFAPTASGSRGGTVTIGDNAAGSPQAVGLTGTGVAQAAVVGLTPGSLSFSSVPVGTSSAAQAVTLANTGNAALSISSIKATGDYAQSNNCTTTLSAGSKCTVSVTFAPSVSGNRSGTLTITDNAQSNPQTVSLTGIGSDFSIASSASSATVKAGATATYTLTVASVGGTFANAVKLSCSGAPAKASCSLSRGSVTPGSSPATAVLTIYTTAASAELKPLRPARNQLVYAVWMQFQGLGIFGMMLAGAKRRTKKLPLLVVLVILLGAMLFMSACAGGTGIGPQPQPGTALGTYTITVSGASGALQHSVAVTLTVQ